jgi:hypothetical protein
MNRISFNENKDFLINCVAKPVIVEQQTLQDIDIQSDLNIVITQTDRSILVKDSQVKSVILPTLGITGLLKKKMIEGTNPEETQAIIRLIRPLLKEHISHFIFFLDTDEKEATSVVTTSLFDKHLEPLNLNNDPQQLRPYLCTTHFPVEPDKNYDVIDFDHSPSDKVYRLNISRPDDRTKEFYPVVHNVSSISYKDKWEQRASIYDRERDIYLTLPRNYAKEMDKPVGEILNHLDTIISQLDINQDYNKEFTEMLMAKLPKGGIEFMMETYFVDHKLVTILDKVESVREELKPSVLKAIYRCLGFMVAQKIHCCTLCRHLDEETL